jgi:hypothetical protein
MATSDSNYFTVTWDASKIAWPDSGKTITFGLSSTTSNTPPPEEMSIEEKIQMLDEMIDIAEGRSEGKAWIKGTAAIQGFDEKGRETLGMCLAGMVYHLGTRMKANITADARHPVMAAIGRAIWEQYRDRLTGEYADIAPQVSEYPGQAIVPFNDHPETTVDDVVRVLEKARMAIAEEV